MSRLALLGARASAAGFFVYDEERGARWAAHAGELNDPESEPELAHCCLEVLRHGQALDATDSKGRAIAVRPVCETQCGCTVAAFIRTDSQGFEQRARQCLDDVVESASKEVRLMLSSSQLAVLVDHMNAGVLFEGADRRGQMVNREFCALFGMLPTDAVGLFGGGLLAKARGFFESPGEFVRSTNRALRRGEAKRGERFATRDGRWLERDYVPISMPHGNDGHLWLFRDVTHELEAEVGLLERNAWLRLLVVLAEMASSTTDEHTTLVRASALICEHARWLGGRVAMPSDEQPIVRQATESAEVCWEHSRQNLGRTLRAQRARTHLACPIRMSGEVARVLVFELEGHVTPRSSTLEALTVVANTLGQSLARLRREQEMREQSLVDPLTTMYNRRGFMLLGQQQLKLAARQKGSLVVFFMDLNGLKTINDQHGHDVGDQAICDAAVVLKACFRSTDIVARLAGDEYCVLSVDLEQSDIPNVLSRLSAQLEGFNQHETRRYELAMSVRYAVFDSDEDSTIHDLLRTADQDMYRNKQAHKRRLRESLRAEALKARAS
ncbi:MAG: diguanylate cyclase [Myxococcales bacterium]|nr:diguanylate cyclase [Myxococcales bacterium]